MSRSWATVRCAALGFFIAAFSPNMDLAAVVVSSLVSCLCYSTGNLIRAVDMPPYWRWFTHINFLYYAWAALMKNEFESCGTVFVGGSTVSSCYDCLCIHQAVPPRTPCTVQVLEFYGFVGGVSKWHYLAAEASFFFVFVLGSYLAMRYIRHQRR